MKQINKSRKFASKYFEALTELGKGEHSCFKESPFRNEHFANVRMNLLYCQDGLCAYTEQILVKREDLLDDKWVTGEFDGSINPSCDVDHFDPSLKTKYGWTWSNLFAISTTINMRVKLGKSVSSKLKPDNPDYVPEKYFDYNMYEHIFIVSQKVPIEEYQEIEDGIIALGLNNPMVVARREDYVNNFMHLHNLRGKKDCTQFVTAVKFCIENSDIYYSIYL
jgi:hypothetical protein